MKNPLFTQILRKGVSGIVAFIMMASIVFGQNLVVNNGGSFTGSGTINVRGNINTSGASGGVAIPGTVNLNGTSGTQQLGVSGSNPLTFEILQATGSVAKQSDVNVTVTDALTVNISAGNFDIQATTLTLSGSSTLTTGTLDVSNAGSTVIYNQTGTNQSVLGLAYAGALTFSGTSTKNFGGAASVAGTFSHIGGDLTVNENFTVSFATPSFTTIADVSASRTLTLSGTGAKSITAITSTNVTGVIDHTGASGLLTIATLTDNLGTINTGAGGVTFTNAAVNGGTITGGAGAVTFSSTLAQSAGTITAGSGDIAFNGEVTIDGGTITSASAGNVLDFNANVNNTGSANITLTSTGEAAFNGSLNATGLSFASGSTVTFDGASQTVPAATYGNLTIDGSASKTGAASFAVAGNLVLNQDLDMFTNTATLTFANEPSTVTGTNEVIGAVSRTHTFTDDAVYAFNRAEVTAAFVEGDQTEDVTITMRPGVAPTGVGANFINRFYGVSSTADLSTNNMNLQLYYVDGEISGSVTETRLGLRKYDGVSLTKYGTDGGTYTRNVAGGTNTIALSNLNQGLTGIEQFALTPLTFQTIADGNWASTATWGSTPDDVPTATDDAEVFHAVSVAVNATIANLTVVDDVTFNGELNVDGADFNATTITNDGGLVSVSAARTLAVSGAFANNAGSGATPAELVTVSGIANLAAVTNNVVFTAANGGVVLATGTFTNAATATLNTVGTGALTVDGADLVNAGAVSNAGSITIED